MKQKRIEAINLEDMIKESMIEASCATNPILNEEIPDDDDDDMEKSLSLNGTNIQKDNILDELFSNKEAKFNDSELERLCDTSGVMFLDKKTSLPVP